MVQIVYFQNRLKLVTTEDPSVVEGLKDLLLKAKTELETHTTNGSTMAMEIIQDVRETLYEMIETGKLDRTDFLLADIRASVSEAREAFRTDRILQVGPGREFTTISEAIRAAAAGDTLSIAPGTYEEDLIIDKPGLTLEGELSATQVRLRGSITILENAVTLHQLTIYQAGKDGITLENAAYVTLAENVLTEHPNNGLTVRGAYRYLLIDRNQITRNGFDGVNLHGTQGSQVAVLSSDVSDNGQSNARGVGVRIGGVKDVIVNQSIFKNNAFAATHPEYPPPPIIDHVCEFAGNNQATNFRIYKIYGSLELLLKNHPCSLPAVVIENQGPMTVIVFIKKPYPNGDDETLAILAPQQSARIPFPPDGHLFVRLRGGIGEATILVRAPVGN
jgi:hypothetical protein